MSRVQEESTVRAGEVGVNHEPVAQCEERTAGMGVAQWMWGWRDWRVVQPGKPCPGRLEYEMDFATGINRARLLARLRARLDAAEAAGGGAADERPLAPFPARLESPRAVAVAGDSEGTMDVVAEEVEEESAGPGTRQWRSCSSTTLGPRSRSAWTRT